MSIPSDQSQLSASAPGNATAASAARPEGEQGSGEVMRDPLAAPVVINIGLSDFSNDLQRQNVVVQHVDWRPPAGGDVGIAELLSRLGV